MTDDFWNDLEGVGDRTKDVRKSFETLDAMVSRESIRDLIPRTAFQAASDQIVHEAKELLRWAQSLRRTLE